MAERDQLRPDQIFALNFISGRQSRGLFLPVGTGKTWTVLASLTPEDLPALVVSTPNIVQNVWPEEVAARRPDLTCAVAAGPPARRLEILQGDTDLVTISFGSLPDRAARTRRPVLPPKHRFKTIIVDESSFAKNASSLTNWHLRKISEGRKVICMTGTPVPNGYLDLFGQVLLLDGGARFGKQFATYRDRYFTPAAYATTSTGVRVAVKYEPRPGAEAAIRRKIEDLCLSTASPPGIPPVLETVRFVTLPPKARAVTEELIEDLTALIEAAGSVTAANAMTLTGMLGQVAAGFVYPDYEERVQGAPAIRLHEAKLDALEEIVAGAGGSPILVGYQYQEELAMLKERFGAFDSRTPNMQLRWNAGELLMLALHPKSAGHGLNLQKGPGHTLVWLSPTWSAELREQLNGRLARPGQRSPVQVIDVLARDTIEEVMYARVCREKLPLQRALLDYLRI